MVQPSDIKQWLKQGLPDAQITVEGDGQHFEAVVISAQFEGKSMLERHRMVYDVLGDKMRHAIHALSIKALTPEQEGEKK